MQIVTIGARSSAYFYANYMQRDGQGSPYHTICEKPETRVAPGSILAVTGSWRSGICPQTIPSLLYPRDTGPPAYALGERAIRSKTRRKNP